MRFMQRVHVCCVQIEIFDFTVLSSLLTEVCNYQTSKKYQPFIFSQNLERGKQRSILTWNFLSYFLNNAQIKVPSSTPWSSNSQLLASCNPTHPQKNIYSTFFPLWYFPFLLVFTHQIPKNRVLSFVLPYHYNSCHLRLM